MNGTSLLRISMLAAVSIALAGTPEFSLAQRSGFHGGGGSFHGGGLSGHSGGGGFGGFHNGGSFRGGGGFGNFHGGNFGNFNRGGFHNGFGGFRGRGFGGFRGNRFFGGFGGYPFFYGFDFGFWPYWDGYPYWYGYGPGFGPYAYYYPYYYPPDPYYDPDYRYPDDRYPDDHRCRPDYRHPEIRCNDAPSDRSNKPTGNNPPAKPSSTGVPESSPERDYVTRSFADERHALLNGGIAAATPVGSNYQLANFTTQQLPSELRPAVRNVIEALRAMPPDARERQLQSGRYDGFSPEEREALMNASQAAQVN